MGVRMKRLDHVNVRTSRLGEMILWYGEMLGMEPGPRPDFGFPGAWLYAGEHAVLHLIETEAEPGAAANDLKLEHFALSATGIGDLLTACRERGERAELRKVPDFPIVQVNLWDPDGNHIHIDFDEDEALSAGVLD